MKGYVKGDVKGEGLGVFHRNRQRQYTVVVVEEMRRGRRMKGDLKGLLKGEGLGIFHRNGQR